MNKTKLKELKTQIQTKQKEFQTYCHEQFKLGAKELFDENPGLKSFGMKGWVPYFNDGDICEFSAHTGSPDINEFDGYDIDYSDEPEHKDARKLQEKVKDFLAAFGDDFYQQLFGSHFAVVVTPDKITVEEYCDHD